jgi:hypothetical protein
MATYDSDIDSTGNLTTKISTLIDGQLPDFIQSDHPIFSVFLKHYYEYLEAAELRVTVNIDNLLLELETASNVLDVDGNKITLEVGAGTEGKFIVGETITGGTSKATAKILVDDLSNSTTPRIFITSQQKFVTGETITGGTSSSSAVVTRYRANPVQTIQQLLAYADIDNTIYDFLDQFRDEFMNAIPLTLADGVSKRSLVKNIRELYRAKGTSEGHKIFFNMILGETPEVIYPNKYMVRASGGNWGNKLIMRVAPSGSAVGDQAIGRTITGLTSGASAVVVSSLSVNESSVSIIEFELNRDSLSPNASFVRGETIQVVSNVTDTLMSFTVNSIVSSVTVNERGALYGASEIFPLDTDENIGNGEATARVNNINSGEVSGVVVDDAGTKYEVGDVLTFTTTDSNTSTAAGFVSIIDGSIVINGTDKYSTDGGDFLVFEDATTEQEYLVDIELETATEESVGQKLLLNGTDGDSLHAGHSFILETTFVGEDTYGTVGGDQIAIEEGTDYTGGITKIFLANGGSGYNKLPTVTVTSTSGTSTSLLATTDNIGAVGEVDITNAGFAYTAEPTSDFNANFVLKDITGTFAANETLASSGHTGTIVSFDDTTNVLKTSFDNVVRLELEVADEEGITLEDSLRVGGDDLDTRMIFDDTLDEEEFILTEDGAQFIGLNATATDDEYIVLDDGTGETAGSAIVLESPDNVINFPIQLESSSRDGTDIGDGIQTEDGQSIIVSDEFNSIGATSYQLERILTEESTLLSSQLQNDDSRLITNAAFDTIGSGDPSGFTLLEGTDTTVVDGLFTDENSRILNEEFGDHNQIVLDGIDSDGTDENTLLLQDVDEGDGQIIFDGTNADGADENGHVVFTTIDFFEDATGINPHPTTITSSSGASAKIAKANIASGVAVISTTAETAKTYGQDITSLIGEDLNRIQDSYYYQQFSYEIEAGFGSNSYLDQLKKAVHPAGFAIFGKVKIASSVSTAIANAGSSLGGGYYSNINSVEPDDKFSPILASTFKVLFDETFQRRLGTNPNGNEVGAYEQRVILEDAEDVTFITDAILLNGTDSSSSDAGSFLREEETAFIRLDERIKLEDTTDTTATSPESFIIQEGGDRIISEAGIALSNNLALDGTGDSGHVSPTDAGGDILLDGTDSDGTDYEESLELEIASSDHVGKFGLFALTNEDNTLLNEAGGSQQLETSNVGGGSDYDLSVVSIISTKVNIPLATPRHANNGLTLLGLDPFHNSSTFIELEKGTQKSGRLVINFGEDRFGTIIDEGVRFLLEDDPNNNSHFTFDNILEYENDKIVLNGTDGSSTNAGDSIVLNGTDENSSNADADIIGESVSTYSNITLSDIIRPDLIVLSHDSQLGDDRGTDHEIDSANTRPSDPVAILLEESQETGFFRQENETTAPEHYGDKIVLEDKTGVGFNNKLIIESDRLEAEDGSSSGTVPFQNLTNSNFEPFARSSFIQTTEYGAIDLEDDAFEVTNIQLEDGFGSDGNNLVYDGTDPLGLYENNPITMQSFFDTGVSHGEGAVVLNGTDDSSTNAGDRFRFELATDENIDNIHPASYATGAGGFGGFDISRSIRFDSSAKTFDATV